MHTEQRENQSLDLICRHVAELESRHPESAQQELRQGRLRSLQDWICDLLIENELLRMSAVDSASEAEVKLEPIVTWDTPTMVTSLT